MPPSAIAADPAISRQDLFEGGKNDYALYRIPGTVACGKNTVLAYCEARKTNSDWADIAVLLRRSTDGGQTWDEPRKIAHLGDRVPRSTVPAANTRSLAMNQTVNNPSAIATPGSDVVHFLYCVEYGRCFYQRSDDGGKTFAAPVDITSAFDGLRKVYDVKVVATGPGHGVKLRTGRLVMSVWVSPGTGRNGHHPSVAATIYSDDDGKTWKSGDVAVPATDEMPDPNETTIAELSDGRVMLNVRTEAKAGRRVVVTSGDGATGWSKPRFDAALLEPICMGSLTALPPSKAGDPRLLAFVNPHNIRRSPDGSEAGGKSGERRNLSVKLSDDDGKTWSADRVLESGLSGYSDVVALPDGSIGCFYERAVDGGKNAAGRLTFAKFDAAWVKAKAEK